MKNRLADDDEGATFDVDVAKERKRKRLEEMLKNPIVSETPHGGDVIPNGDIAPVSR